MRWFVVDTRIYEVTAPSEAEAIALVEDQRQRPPVCHTTTAQPSVLRRAPAPVLRVLVGDLS